MNVITASGWPGRLDRARAAFTRRLPDSRNLGMRSGMYT